MDPWQTWREMKVIETRCSNSFGGTSRAGCRVTERVLLNKFNELIEIARKPIEEQARTNAALFEEEAATILNFARSKLLFPVDEGNWPEAHWPFGCRDALRRRGPGPPSATGKKHGQWSRFASRALSPEYLPAVPLDPFDGKPLRPETASRTASLSTQSAWTRTDDGGGPTPTRKNAKRQGRRLSTVGT